MATITLTHLMRKEFIAGLSLPETPASLRGLRYLRARGDTSTFIDAGSIVTFAGAVTDQQRQDVLNSMLLAQLAADRKYDRESALENWFKFYATVFEHLGWALSDTKFNTFDAHGKTLDVDKAVLEVIAAIATSNELAAITAAISAAKGLADKDGRITLFDHFVSRAKTGAFQVGIAAQNEGSITLKLGAFRYQSMENVTKVLWFKFSTADTEISYTRQGVTLNTEVFALVRDTIRQKLGDDAKAFIAGI
jgi:hypothetical protein